MIDVMQKTKFLKLQKVMSLHVNNLGQNNDIKFSTFMNEKHLFQGCD